jgi:hypothetical protein
LRVAVLDARTAVIPLAGVRGPLRADLDDPRLFELVAEWLRTGKFPAASSRPRRFVDIGADRGRVSLDASKKS